MTPTESALDAPGPLRVRASAVAAPGRHRRRTVDALAAARVLILLVLLPLGAHAAPPEVAVVTDLKGKVERLPDPEGHWARVRLEDGVRLHDALRTWDKSLAELRFVDGTVLLLGERTRMTISAALFDPGKAPPQIRVALAAGGVDVRAGKVPLVVEHGGHARRFAPGESGHARGNDGGLDVGPTRYRASADLAPEGGFELDRVVGPAVELGPETEVPGEIDLDPELAPLDPERSPPDMPEPPDDGPPDEMPPDVEPEPDPDPDPTPDRTGARVRVRVRGGTP